MTNHIYNRRTFIKHTGRAGACVPVIPYLTWEDRRKPTFSNEELEVSVFSKHLQFLSYPDMASVARDIGFDGVELTVRNKGHVLPEKATEDLPSAVSAIDPKLMGAQYDIRHAVVEGGGSWPNGIKLIKDRITTLAIKDFRWEKAAGKWQILNTPLGEGMVDFPAFFKILKEYDINVPVTMHFEYDLFGVEHGATEVNN